ncbi:MAG TPA: DUF3037 domain-containing protein [Longimicrobiaceae bacterium]|nr:DUF3037 domain-containing protein [Longimicrobiaceae bacterium]
MSADRRTTYHYAVLRLVPRVHRGEFVNVGVIVHARTAEFLGMRVITDPVALQEMAPGVDAELLARYLQCHERIAAGDAAAGEIAALPTSERFHWLTAPRSDVLQSSPVHEGLGEDPARALDELFAELVGEPEPRG